MEDQPKKTSLSKGNSEGKEGEEEMIKSKEKKQNFPQSLRKS